MLGLWTKFLPFLNVSQKASDQFQQRTFATIETVLTINPDELLLKENSKDVVTITLNYW